MSALTAVRPTSVSLGNISAFTWVVLGNKVETLRIVWVCLGIYARPGIVVVVGSKLPNYVRKIMKYILETTNRITAAGPKFTPVNAWVDGKPGAQETNDAGVLLWRANFLLSDGENLETIAVRFPMASEPVLTAMQKVEVKKLTLTVGKNGTCYFDAEGITVAKA